MDGRSLAAFRIAIGLCLLGDLWTRVGSAEMFYTDRGALPRAVIARSVESVPHLQLFFLGGGVGWVYALFAISAALALCFVLGLFTRLVTVLSWLLVASLHVRNPMVLQGGDILVLVALFWSLFLPLERRWSIDARASGADANREPVLNVGTVALTLQLFAMYFVSGLLKARMEYWQRGEGVYNALSADHFVTGFGKWLYQFDDALVWLSHGTLVLELAGPFLLFVPFAFGWVRTGLVFLFIGFHAGLGSSLELGSFPWVSAAVWLFALPGWFWDTLASSSLGGRLAQLATKLGRVLAPTVGVLVRWRRFAGRPFAPLGLWVERQGLLNVTQLLAAAALAYSTLQAVAELHPRLGPRGALAQPTFWFRLTQSWRMFVPPYADAGWFVAAGTKVDGTTSDVLFGSDVPLSWERPAHVAETFPDQRWRKYLVNLRKPMFAGYRRWLGVGLCHQWNDIHRAEGARLTEVELVYLKRTIGPHYQRGPVQRDSWIRVRCPA